MDPFIRNQVLQGLKISQTFAFTANTFKIGKYTIYYYISEKAPLTFFKTFFCQTIF